MLIRKVRRAPRSRACRAFRSRRPARVVPNLPLLPLLLREPLRATNSSRQSLMPRPSLGQVSRVLSLGTDRKHRRIFRGCLFQKGPRSQGRIKWERCQPWVLQVGKAPGVVTRRKPRKNFRRQSNLSVQRPPRRRFLRGTRSEDLRANPPARLHLLEWIP